MPLGWIMDQIASSRAHKMPRIIIALSLVLSLTLLYYISNIQSFHCFTATTSTTQTVSVTNLIRNSEELYQKFLKDRAEFITKVGPTREEVDGCVTGGQP